MLEPKRTKHRKVQRKQGLTRGEYATSGTRLNFGDFGLKSLEKDEVTSRQLEAARVAINRHLKRAGKVWIRVFPDKPITKKPAEVRMGKGKGAVDHYIHDLKAGKVIFEIEGVTEEIAKEALRRAGSKLPIKTRFIKKQ